MRTRRHQPAAAEACDSACERWERADEVWNAIEWTLARDPLAGVALNEAGKTRSFMIQGARSVGWPTLTVTYTIDGEELITIHEAIFEEAGIYRAGHA